jgi:hypothetical protein
LDAFGDAILEQEDKLDNAMQAGQTVQSKMYYFWEDNPFIHGEPHDKMLGPIANGTAKVTSRVSKIVYADGSVESFRTKPFPAPLTHFSIGGDGTP